MKLPFPLSVAAGFLILAVQPCEALDTVLRYPTVTQRNLNTVCWTGTQFVAAGEFGFVSRSPDGVTWTSMELPGTPALLSSAAGAGRVVVAGKETALFSSADGVTWTPETMPGQSPYVYIGDVAFNGSVFRAINSNGSGSWNSPDGKTWTMPASGAAVARLAVHASEFVAWSRDASDGVHQDFLRDDGSGWTSTKTNLTQPMQALVWTDARYVTVGKAGTVATSTDGTTWTLRTTGVPNDLNQVVWTGSLSVAVGTGGTVITSPNGATWTPRNSGTTADLTSIAWSGSSLVAVGKGGVILRSTDGIAWSAVQAATPPVNAAGVAWTGNSAIAVGPEGTLLSSDGLSWTKTAATGGPNSLWFRATAGNGHIVATGGAGVWTAPPDASAWVNTGFPGGLGIPPPAGVSVVWDGQQFTALLARSNRQQTADDFLLTHSADGVVWGPMSGLGSSTFYPTGGAPVGDLALSGGTLVISGFGQSAAQWNSSFLFPSTGEILGVGPAGSIYESTNNGGSWTTSATGAVFPFGSYLHSVVWTGTRLLGVGSYSTEGIWEASPGRQWTKIHPVGGTSIAWTGTRAIVATGSSIFTFENPDTGLPLTWAQWRAQYFTGAQLNDASVSGPAADPDGDGYANLVEYSTGTSPVSRATAPVLTVVPVQDGAARALQWTQDTSRTDVSVKGEISDDLDVWDLVIPVPVSGTAGGVRLMQASAPPAQKTFFFRLRASQGQ